MRGPGCQLLDREHGNREPNRKNRNQQPGALAAAVRTFEPGARTHRGERQPERLRNADESVRRLTHPIEVSRQAGTVWQVSRF